MCLDLGLGEKGLIGHTQPRRLAARSVAERIAEELGQKIGETVGYQVRFTSEVGEHSAIKLMTDGILLAEIQNDKLLRRYSTLIIDEAHERSLNIDFILGYLKRILPQRPDLKVIITSATIDPERFARHFSPSYVPGKGIVDENLSAEEREIAEAILPDDAPPIIEVSGRTYPVEIRYRPLDEEDYLSDDEIEDDHDPTDGILDAIKELSKEAPGDILIFFSGEREIRDAKDAIEAMVLKSPRLNYEVLPLYARLSLAEQHRVFSPGSRPRIVLATNVAETSLTVPGIKYVIDTGTARISRYSARTKVQRLPIETHLAGKRQPALRSMRPRQRRHRNPPLLRGRLQLTPRVHRPRNSAHQPRSRHPADDRNRRGPRTRRHLPLPVRAAARIPRHQRRREPAARTRRAHRTPPPAPQGPRQ